MAMIWMIEITWKVIKVMECNRKRRLKAGWKCCFHWPDLIVPSFDKEITFETTFKQATIVLLFCNSDNKNKRGDFAMLAKTNVFHYKVPDKQHKFYEK
eukprot:m.136204 g.136204  ORF g.136204 m.136204 type:complete len:98 (-) comp10491_c0_seq1:59-352(-)